MLKKRVIFTLLYENGYFVLSRNFRLQKIGDLNWLTKNYNFKNVSFHIDELIILDISRGHRNFEEFKKMLEKITAECFVPITAGGGIKTITQARELLRSGADKVVINSSLFECQDFVNELSYEFGQQCLVGSIDLKRASDGEHYIFINNGARKISVPAKNKFLEFSNELVGEFYLNSMDQDGTGQGLDMEILSLIPAELKTPIILAGGVGHSDHILRGLSDERVNAISTANLLNFIGNGLENARKLILSEGISLAKWEHPNVLKSDLQLDIE